MIHTVAPGETVYSIAKDYSVSSGDLIRLNRLQPPYLLIPGMTLLILRPLGSILSQPEESAAALAARAGIPLQTLLQYNPSLPPEGAIPAGERYVTDYGEQPTAGLSLLGYAYPFIDPTLYRSVLPYLTAVSVFTYGFTPEGELIRPDGAEALTGLASTYGSAAYLELATLTDAGNFDSALLPRLLAVQGAAKRLFREVIAELRRLGMQGAEVDFEYIPLSEKEGFLGFLQAFADALHDEGYLLSVTLAPKTRDDQPGLLYESHDYARIGEIADGVLLMTYEWGYKYGPPQAVAPLPNVRAVLNYALTRIPAEKILLGFPNYGYDWPLPYEKGKTAAETISNRQAVERAIQYRTEILFDEQASAPYYQYTDENGISHIVWFEDLRSAADKAALASDTGLRGLGIWTVMRPFPGFYLQLATSYQIR